MASSTDNEIVTGRVIRPIEWSTLVMLARAPYVLFVLAGLSGVPIFVSPAARESMRNVPMAAADAVFSVAFGIAVFVFVEIFRDMFRSYAEWFVVGTFIVADFAITGAVVAYGPSFATVTVIYPQIAIFAVVLFRLRWAVLALALVGFDAASVMALQSGWTAPVGQWILVMIATLGIGFTAGTMTARVIASVASERRALDELGELNATLQQRVDAQVAELERTGQLRRFLAPQIADAVLSGDADELLGAHRRHVAVFFCDLRRFTAFVAQVEPEDVIDVLGTYYRIVGERLRANNATVGGFSGDGIMAYFNDPVPCEDPAGTAVAMARAVRDDVQVEIEKWRRRGYDLGLGIGVAVGHATLGVVGYSGRQDYTALGTVVNLASRLCGAARDGQILIDLRTAEELDGAVATEPIEGVRLKGFPPELEVHAVR